MGLSAGFSFYSESSISTSNPTQIMLTIFTDYYYKKKHFSVVESSSLIRAPLDVNNTYNSANG